MDLLMKFKKLKKGDLFRKKNPNILELDSDVLHKFNSIHIHDGCTLTVKPWKGRNVYEIERNEHLNRQHYIDEHKLDKLVSSWTKHSIVTFSYDIQQLILSYISSDFSLWRGGKLLIKCATNIIVEKGGKIEVDQCGYTSGSYYTSGESCNNMGKFQVKSPNIGGGGAGLNDKCGGGGAGYGTKGDNGYIDDNILTDDEYADNGNKVGLGGDIYGNKYLSTLYLGSGGGGSQCNVGGDGGGAISLECENLINYGQITANGGDSMIGAGAGSGGSIHIVVHKSIVMDSESLIQAKGGVGGKWGIYGNGGHGRIRIDVHKNYYNHVQDIIKLKRINPPPYVAQKN